MSEWLPGEGIPALLERYNGPIRGIEIGSDRGCTSNYLLEKIPDLTLYAIDPYTEYVDWNNNFLFQLERDDAFRQFSSIIQKHGRDRLCLIPKRSDDVVIYFDDESVDFIFIDGIHTYEQVIKDCENYYGKIKSGGLLCGHDYNSVTGVAKAVNEFSCRINKEVMFTRQDVWYWFKD